MNYLPVVVDSSGCACYLLDGYVELTPDVTLFLLFTR